MSGQSECGTRNCSRKDTTSGEEPLQGVVGVGMGMEGKSGGVDGELASEP